MKIDVDANKAIPKSKRSQLRHYLELTLDELIQASTKDQTTLNTVFANRFHVAELKDGEWPSAFIWTLSETNERISRSTEYPEATVAITVVSKANRALTNTLDELVDSVNTHMMTKQHLLSFISKLTTTGSTDKQVFNANSLIKNITYVDVRFDYSSASESGVASATITYNIKYDLNGSIIKSVEATA